MYDRIGSPRERVKIEEKRRGLGIEPKSHKRPEL